jgi:hypothetical protein
MTTEKLEDIIGLSDVNHRTDNTMTTEKLEDIKGLSDVNHKTLKLFCGHCIVCLMIYV